MVKIRQVDLNEEERKQIFGDFNNYWSDERKKRF